MKKFFLTVVFGIVLSTATFATSTGEVKDVKVTTVESDKVELTYLSDGECKVKVNIYDQKGSRVFTESIKNPKSFKKAYDLSKLPVGEYEFEIIDNEKVVSEKVKVAPAYDDTRYIKASVVKEEGEKYSVKVVGAVIDPIAINIYNKYGELIYGDLIDISKGFTRIYDLSKAISTDVKFEIVQNGEIIAATTF